MSRDQPEELRKYGYDILINRFEPLFRDVIKNEVLLIYYGLKKWPEGIPKGVIEKLKEEKEIYISKIDINDFFDEIYLWGLKEISIFSDNYEHLKDFVSNLGKEKFIEVMDELNEIRKKIAHSKTFTRLDLLRLIDLIKLSFHGKLCEEFIKYIDNEGYKNADDIPSDFMTRYQCQNNLPVEEYDLDGGFVGRRREIKTLKKLLYSNQDRINSITGAGGVGKTAVALKLAYSILGDENNPYEAIIWFSAKETKLTPDGIVGINPQIRDYQQLLRDILLLIDKDTCEIFEKNKIPYDKYKEHLYSIFSSQRCLIVIDNLETVLRDQETIDFIKGIPRDSQVLITSRRGLGELENRYPLPDFDERSAIGLFRLIAKEKNRNDLLALEEEAIASLVNKVKCYPLLIKWSIGKVCLGQEITEAFAEIYSGKTEIAEFVFNDIFELFDQESKVILYSILILGDKPISKHLLKHLSNLDEDQFEDAIKELMIASFIYQDVTTNQDGSILTNYSMLSLTRGFVQTKLDEDKKTLNILQNRYYDLTQQIEQIEKSTKVYDESLFSLGIKTDDEKIAFNYVKTAKNYIRNGEHDKAEECFKNAAKMAPAFAYALIEYAKFEFSREHLHEANTLFDRAINADKDNFHSFFSYGICLKKQSKIKEAISILERAKELNPSHLPIYNELGRVYSFNGEYEKADKFFEQANKQQKYVDYRHMFITLHYQADNYRRWSEQFFERQDYEGGMLKLNQALKLAKMAVEIREGDKTLLLLEKEVCKNIAIKLCENGKFEEAQPYFEKCFEKIRLANGIVLSSDYSMAEANYYLAYFAFSLNKLPLERILIYIKKALAINRNDNYTRKLLELKKKVESKLRDSSLDYKYGIVEWFNKYRHFGIIRSENNTYLFFLNNFKKRLLDEEIEELSGKTVSFLIEINPRDKKSYIATKISIVY